MLLMSIPESSLLAVSKSARAYFQTVLGLQGFGLKGTCHFVVVRIPLHSKKMSFLRFRVTEIW